MLASGPVEVEVVNTSSVPATLAVTLTTGGLLGALTTVETCSLPWTPSHTCPGTRTQVASTKVVSLAGAATSRWTTALAPGDVQHVKLSTGLGVARSVSVRVSAHATPHDRTTG